MTQKWIALIFKCFIVLIYSSTSALERDDPFPSKYVVTIPVYAPSSLESDLESEGEEDPSIPSAYFKNPPYSIDSSRRGKIEFFDPEDSDTPNEASNIIETLRSRFFQESFGTTKEESESEFSSRGSLSLFLNRLKSLSSQVNQALTKKYKHDSKASNLRVTRAFWTIPWKKTTKTSTGQQRQEFVLFDEVLKFYRAFKKVNKVRALHFLKEQEEVPLTPLIPYRELREVIKNHPNTIELIRLFGTSSLLHPIYLGIFDADVHSLRTLGTEKNIGVFTIYDTLIQSHWRMKHVLPHLMSTGYAPSPRPFKDQNAFHFLDVGLELDRMVRQAIFSVFANGLYYPEPNSLILILEGCSTVKESFLDQSDLNYKFPQEMLIMSQHLISSRRLKPNDVFIFDGRFPIVTRAPERMLTYRKGGKETPFTITCIWDAQSHQFIFWTETDFTNFPQISQSHLNVYAGWTQNILRALENLCKKNPLYPSSKKGIPYAHQKRISLLSTLLASYDPLSLASSSEDFGLTLKSLVKNYIGCTPGPLRITYTPNPSKSSKRIGAPKLSQHQVDFQDWIGSFRTIEDLKRGIDCFFTEPVADQIEDAARKSGEAVCRVIARYFSFDLSHLSETAPSTPSPIQKISQDETPPDALFPHDPFAKKSSRSLFSEFPKKKTDEAQAAEDNPLSLRPLKEEFLLEDDPPIHNVLTLSPQEIFLESFFQRPYERSLVTLLLTSLSNASHLAAQIHKDGPTISKLKKPEKYGPLEANAQLVWRLFRGKSVDEIRKILNLKNIDAFSEKIGNSQ